MNRTKDPRYTPPELDLLRDMAEGRVRDPIDSPVLTRCIERGWVEVSGPKKRRVWRLTEVGRIEAMKGSK